VSVSKRAFFFALIGAVVVFFAGIGGDVWAVVAFTLQLLILISLFVLDVISSPSPKKINVERIMETKLSLAALNKVEIIVRNGSNHKLKIYVTDDIPFHFTNNLPMEPGFISPHGQLSYFYEITPLKRGEFLFPAIHIEYNGIYGFCVRKKTFHTENTYKVYPNMKALSDYRLSSLSRNMFFQGIKRIRQASFEGEFDSLRDYSEGDSYKHINWRATAHNNKLIVNTYMPEKNQFINIMLDSSRVMNSEINNIKKLDYAINASFLLADYCINGGDNVGLLVFDRQVRRFLYPGKGPAQFENIAENLYNVNDTETSADYITAMSAIANKQRRRSLIFIFTELFNSDEAVRFADSVKKFLCNHIVYAITINDPRLTKYASLTPNNIDEIYLKSAAVKMLSERNKIKAVLNSAGIMNTDADPDKLSIEAVSKYVEIKSTGRL